MAAPLRASTNIHIGQGRDAPSDQATTKWRQAGALNQIGRLTVSANIPMAMNNAAIEVYKGHSNTQILDSDHTPRMSREEGTPRRMATRLNQPACNRPTANRAVRAMSSDCMTAAYPSSPAPPSSDHRLFTTEGAENTEKDTKSDNASAVCFFRIRLCFLCALCGKCLLRLYR